MKRLHVRIGRLFAWLDQYLLFGLSLFLIVFIPLYPKLPLADLLPGYIVRLRLEDIFVLLTAILYCVWWARKKVNPLKNPLFLFFACYIGIGFLSGLSAMFLTKTIPLQTIHVVKWALHFVRRIEYAFLLFLLYDSVKTKRHARIILMAFLGVVLVVAVYGFGQKYYQWPVYSTMNREFAKGWRLVLTEHARVPSTFAGHYDLAAYLVLLLPVSIAIALFGKQRWLKCMGWASFVLGYILLILTASRASFISYGVATVALFGAFLFIRNWVFVVTRFIGVALFSAFVFFTFGDLSGRFAQIINLGGVRTYIENDILRLDKTVPHNYLTLTDQLALVADKTDVPPTVYTQGKGSSGGSSPGKREQYATSGARPADVYEDIPMYTATMSATGEATYIVSQRSYSDNAFSYGLSSAIRFDALWPRAIAGFKRNVLLGSGYSTLTKIQVTDFSEAESTDNDYLRALGETGLFGFIAFFGTIVYALVLLWKKQKGIMKSSRAIVFAVMAGAIGLLVNATYIDVFEASKVAFTFWALLGLSFAMTQKNIA